MQVIVHGGAGASPDDPERRQGVLDEAAAAGAGESGPVDAVVAAVRVLESSPRFNAGVGGAVQSDGVVRTDAGLMTDDRSVGAACAMPGVEHAVEAARVVMQETPHVLVAGEHAVDLATDFGVETGVDLLTADTRKRFAESDPPEGGPRDHLDWIDERFGSGVDESDAAGAVADPTDGGSDGGKPTDTSPPADRTDHDTVGAVARDGDRFAAATSTGGRWFALAGRVGDVPQVGSGFYCSPAGGASATGAGEDIAKATVARRAVRLLEEGVDAQAAADRAIAEFGELTGSNAGVIVADGEGTGRAYNTDAMQTAVARE